MSRNAGESRPDIKPGMFGLARIGGLLGKLIAAAQAFAGDGSRWTHAFVVVWHDGQLKVIEAEPGGARLAPIEEYLGDKVEVAFTDEPVQIRLKRTWSDVLAAGEPSAPAAFKAYFEDRIREDFSDTALRLEGTRYGYLQYVYLGLLALAGKDGSLDQPRGPITRWLANRITQKGSMICSQLCDEVARRCGVELFDDKRLPQNVTPGDLAIRFGIA